MDVTISAKHMELTEALKNYIEERVGRLNKFTDQNLVADVHLVSDKHRNHIHITVKGNGNFLNAEAEDPANMYKAIDMTVDKLEKQFRRGKHDHHSAKMHKEAMRQSSISVNAPPVITEDEVMQQM